MSFYTISLATAACKPDYKREAEGHHNSGGQLKVATKDTAQASDMYDWETGGATYQAGALEPTKGSLKGSSQEEVLVSRGPQAGWSPSADTLSLSPQAVDGTRSTAPSQLQDLPLRSQCCHHKGRQPRKHGQGGVPDVELPKTASITNFTLWVSPQLLALGGEGNLPEARAPPSPTPHSAGPSTVLPTLGTPRRRKLPRSNMRRPCGPRQRQLAWSSKCGPPGLGENVRAVRALRDY